MFYSPNQKKDHTIYIALILVSRGLSLLLIAETAKEARFLLKGISADFITIISLVEFHA